MCLVEELLVLVGDGEGVVVKVRQYLVDEGFVHPVPEEALTLHIGNCIRLYISEELLSQHSRKYFLVGRNFFLSLPLEVLDIF